MFTDLHLNTMTKRVLVVALLTTTVLLTSCASGWNCKKRYCTTTPVKLIEQKKNV
mgnify:CR=1 FL=1